MQITIGKPISGWLPFSISIGGRCIEFRASNVVNDPLTDLLFAAVWSIAPDYSFPAMSAGINPPHTAPKLRAARFWLEPDWHTLVVEEIGDNNVDLWFAVGHEGGLFIDGNDISTTHLALCGSEPAFTFANVGCHDAEVASELPSVVKPSDNDSNVAVNRLSDIGDPDKVERKVDEILIVGSALTDDHVAAIRRLTDSSKPTKPNRYLIRNIQHTGPNAATNIWQTGHSQIDQDLVLINGVWEVDEEGGGFGQWWISIR